MSGTPEYYFGQRWMSLERLAKIIGHRNFSSERNSFELSYEEQLQDWVQVVESILARSSEIRGVLFENALLKMHFIMKLIFLKHELSRQ